MHLSLVSQLVREFHSVTFKLVGFDASSYDKSDLDTKIIAIKTTFTKELQ